MSDKMNGIQVTAENEVDLIQGLLHAADYKNDEENCRKLLSEAMEKLKGTAWEVMIRQMLEENLALVAER